MQKGCPEGSAVTVQVMNLRPKGSGLGAEGSLTWEQIGVWKSEEEEKISIKVRKINIKVRKINIKSGRSTLRSGISTLRSGISS